MKKEIIIGEGLTGMAIALMTTGLSLFEIPFETHFKMGPWGEIMYNIKFPWASKCDIAISTYGTLHALDDDEEDYPFAETYGFPWDHGDISCFDLRDKDEAKKLFLQLYDLYQWKIKQ